MYYLLIGLCVLFGGVRLIFNKHYINRYGASIRSSLWNTGLSCGIFFLLMLPVNFLLFGNWLNFSLFSFLLALLFGELAFVPEFLKSVCELFCKISKHSQSESNSFFKNFDSFINQGGFILTDRRKLI